MRSLIIAAFIVMLTMASCTAVSPSRGTPQQTQAAAVAVPDPSAPAGVLGIVQCRQLIGMVVTDAHGGLHPIHTVTREQVEAITSAAPPGSVISVTVPGQCDPIT